MDRAGFEDWLRRYFAAWVSNDPSDVAALFTEEAVYEVGPFRDAWHGRDEIVDRWTSGRQEDVRTSFDVLAVDGDVGVAHWGVSARNAGKAAEIEWDGILVVTFAADGRCRRHREWFSHRERG